MNRTISKIFLGTFFVLAGANHFLMPDLYLKIMPPILPFARSLVYISGVAEALGGLSYLLNYQTKLGAWWLVALLAAVFPANIYMLDSPGLFPGVPEWVLWLRLPLQFVLGYVVWWAGQPVQQSAQIGSGLSRVS